MKFLKYRWIAFIVSTPFIFGSYASADIWTDSYRLESIGQYQQAREILNPYGKENPDDEFAMLRLGWLSYLGGSYNQSIKQYQKALSLNPQSLDAALGLMLPLLAQQRWKEAEKYGQQILSVAPWNYYAHLRLMISEEGQRNWHALLQHAQQLHQRFPGDATVLVYLARAQRWQGHQDAARITYRQVLQRYPAHIEALQFLAGD
ncbi:MAG: tetratricopeptide repeat protein [Pseudomonadales bacterium]|nr:tetratricopeptide repeat protein [Pseudomonadales bacterium]